MLQQALTWIVIVGAFVAGLAVAGQRTLREDALGTVTTLVVVGLLAQWLYRENPGFRPGKLWAALLTLGVAMVGLRWLIHQ